MKQYVRKPIPVYVEQFTGNGDKLINFLGAAYLGMSEEGYALIETVEGVRRAKKNDFIVRSPDDTFTVVPAFIFKERYDEYVETKE